MNEHETERRFTVFVHISEPLLQAGVCAALGDACDMHVIDDASGKIEQSIDVVITDSSTAAMIAEEARRFELAAHLQFARILVIAAQTREYAVRSALKQQIHGFVQSASPVHELLLAVRTLANGGKYLCQTVGQQLAQVAERDTLTGREDEVLRLLAKGLCNKLIARDLDIAVGTVKVHVKSIMAKLDASTRTQAASIATERGLVDMLGTSPRHAVPNPGMKVWRASPITQPCFA